MWVIEKYIKYLIGFAILWAGLYFHRSCGCQKVVGRYMSPTFLEDEFIRVRIGKVRPTDGIQCQSLVWFRYNVAGSREKGYLARVIGVPGDRVQMKAGEVYIGGKVLSEGYLKPDMRNTSQSIPEVIVPRDHYYILVDNRRQGLPPDSRRFGPIPFSAVEGEVKR